MLRRVLVPCLVILLFLALASPAFAIGELRRGDIGFDVVLWQRMLNRMTAGEHHDPADILVVDGIFGPETERMTKRFERGAEFKQDGVVTQRERRRWLGAFITCCGAAKAVIGFGSYDADVGLVQMHLNHWYRSEGSDSRRLVIDMMFGPATEAAVRDYQEAHRLVVDGIVGLDTWGEMLRYPKS
jgi:peptidoglycan hydrolase-like protein with peptidoglycan-binding domain